MKQARFRTIVIQAILAGSVMSSGWLGLSCSALRRGGPPPGSVALPPPADVPPPPPPAVTANLGSLAISKWQLDNGLIVILAPDPNATSVALVTTYRVGARDEDAAAHETGLAHLFEHLMFTQTKGAKSAGEFDRVMEEGGGNANAMTSNDTTVYIDEVPPSELGRAIALEADRMVNLDLRPEQVRRERDVVVEERLSSVENDVDGLLDESVYGQAFQSHPYKYPVIGRMEDIKAFTPEAATAFYRRFYGPNRAVLTIAGRFDPATAMYLVTRAYERLPRVAEPPARAITPEKAPAAIVRSRMERPVLAERVQLGYPSPPLGHADRAAYEVLAEILTGGPASRVERQLVVDKELASSVEGEVAPTQDPGLWTVVIQMVKGHTADEAEAILQHEIESLVATPVPDEELSAARNRLETAFWRHLGPSQGKAEALGQFEVVAGDFRNLMERGAAYPRVTAADVQRVAKEYFGSGARSVALAVPSPLPEPEPPVPAEAAAAAGEEPGAGANSDRDEREGKRAKADKADKDDKKSSGRTDKRGKPDKAKDGKSDKAGKPGKTASKDKPTSSTRSRKRR